MYFNPRSHERSDVVEEATKDLALSFQSTLPREERQLPQSSACYGSVISIHAPTRGATSEPIKAFSAPRISIHAPTRGATFSDTDCISARKFQSTLPREERRFSTTCNHSPDLYFNPRSHERSDDSIS